MIDLSAPLSELIDLPDLNAAIALNARRRAWDELDRLAPLSFGERGQIALEFERRALWQYLEPPFKSFDQWMSSGSDASRTTMYAAWRAAKALEDDVPDLAGIPRETVNMMAYELSTAVRSDPEVIEAAKTKDPEEFRNHISETQPDQHIEIHKPLRFKTTESQAKAVEAVIKYAIDQKGAQSREQALEYMAHEALVQWTLEDELKLALENDNGDEELGSRLLQ